MTSLREQLLRFVTELRADGVRISVAESIDAMNAVAAAGLERARMREALAAALVKDEADREVFERAFARFFAGARERGGDDGRRKRGTESSAAPGAREREGESVRPSRGDKRQPSPGKVAKQTRPEEQSKQSDSEESKKRAESESEDRAETEGDAESRQSHPGDVDAAASAAGKEARVRRI